jgi:hypothetical protein
MIYIWLNALPIIAAALVASLLGAIWFHPRPGPGTTAVLFLAQAWLAAILAGALILAPPKGGVWTMTIGSAVVIWAGFVAPVLVASYHLRALSWRCIAQDAGYWLVAMVLEAALMRVMGLVPPPA